MLSANSEVSTNSAITRSIRKVPRIEITPISSGIAAAMTPRKTSSSSSARIGNAISSALVRSLRVWSLTSLKLGAKPPIPTSKRFELIRSEASSAAAPPSSSMSWVASWPVITSERPSSAITGLSRRRSRAMSSSFSSRWSASWSRLGSSGPGRADAGTAGGGRP